MENVMVSYIIVNLTQSAITKGVSLGVLHIGVVHEHAC